MQHPHDDIARYPHGLPAFEIVFDRPTRVRSWALSSSALTGAMARMVL